MRLRMLRTTNYLNPISINVLWQESEWDISLQQLGLNWHTWKILQILDLQII